MNSVEELNDQVNTFAKIPSWGARHEWVMDGWDGWFGA